MATITAYCYGAAITRLTCHSNWWHFATCDVLDVRPTYLCLLESTVRRLDGQGFRTLDAAGKEVTEQPAEQQSGEAGPSSEPNNGSHASAVESDGAGPSSDDASGSGVNPVSADGSSGSGGLEVPEGEGADNGKGKRAWNKTYDKNRYFVPIPGLAHSNHALICCLNVGLFVLSGYATCYL